MPAIQASVETWFAFWRSGCVFGAVLRTGITSKNYGTTLWDSRKDLPTQTKTISKNSHSAIHENLMRMGCDVGYRDRPKDFRQANDGASTVFEA
jgi:hypothetical protein